MHLVIHLVKLINQADTLVSQHQCTTLQRPLLGHRVLVHTSSQTNSGCTLACATSTAVSCQEQQQQHAADGR